MGKIFTKALASQSQIWIRNETSRNIATNNVLRWIRRAERRRKRRRRRRSAHKGEDAIRSIMTERNSVSTLFYNCAEEVTIVSYEFQGKPIGKRVDLALFPPQFDGLILSTSSVSVCHPSSRHSRHSTAPRPLREHKEAQAMIVPSSFHPDLPS